MDDLTPRQRKVFEFIVGCVEERGYAPTLREIGRHLGVRSVNAPSEHVRALERKGYLVREEGKSRALMPVDVKTRAVILPLVHEPRSGSGLLSTMNVRDKVRADRLLTGPTQGVYVFELPEDFSPHLGFLPGDFLFVRRQSRAEKGAVMLLARSGGAVGLERAGGEGKPDLPPGIGNPALPPDAGRPVGVVVGFHRKLARKDEEPGEPSP